MYIGNKFFDTKNQVYIMGILNVTPDSFSDGGNCQTIDAAMFRAEEMIREGADIIDVGGESTRPGYQMISDQEELERVLPVIESLKERFDVPVSVDTYKSAVASGAVAAGADLINDIWGLKYDRKMAAVIAAAKTACCLMHNRETAAYQSYPADVLSDLKKTLDLAEQAGISKDKIILDPGIGFGKNLAHNQILINQLELLTAADYPVLLGTSRKSVVGKTLNLPVNERLEGTIATNVIGVMKGCSFFRVHDIKENKRAVEMAKAIIASRRLEAANG